MIDLSSNPLRPLGPDDFARAAAASKPVADDWRAIVPPPADAPKMTKGELKGIAPAGFEFGQGWHYPDASGSLLHYVARFDHGDGGGKQFRPICWAAGPGGRAGWRPIAPPAPRPLYGLDRLAARPLAPVIVCEGEKAADAATNRFPEWVAVTSSSGSKSAGKADWSPLRGRDVVIWPDNDAPGLAYADDVRRLALEAGASSVRVVAVPVSFPAAWDLGDENPEGWDAGLLAGLLGAPGEHDGATDDEWPEPLGVGSTLPPVAPFADDLLPDCLRAYVMDAADRMQAPPDFAAVACLCGLAAVLGNKVRIAPKARDNWTVVPNLWGAIVGAPSAMKSPALTSALAPVYAIQDALREEWEESRKDDAIEDALATLSVKDAKKRAAKLLKDGDRDAAASALKSATAGDDDGAPCPRLVVNDVTVEKLGVLLNENPRGLLQIRDELPGFLAKMENDEFQQDRAFYLEAFNGDGRFTYDRIGRGTVEIKCCTMSLIGGVQPSRIAPIVRGALTGASNDGLIQRLQMLVWPDSRQGWRWVDRAPDEAAEGRYHQAFRDLYHLQLGEGEEPAVLRFAPRAQEMFKRWSEEIHAEAKGGSLPPTLESHLLKMQKTVASLALIFELVDGGRDSVGDDATARALDWADYLRTHANRLYAAGATVVEDGARLILDRRLQLPAPFTLRNVHQKGWAGLTDRDTVEAAIDVLVSCHCCREVQVAQPVGRPTRAFEWNPRLKGGG